MFGTNITMDKYYDELLAELSANLMSYVIAFAGYVLLGMGMYAIAKRRGITNPWLAWVPFGQSWMLGCISDQFQYVTMGRERNKRKLLLWLELGLCAVMVAVCVLTVWVLQNSNMEIYTGQSVTGQMVQQRVNDISTQLMAILFLAMAMLGLAITYTVMKYVTLYDLFRSCDPVKAALFTLLSIFLGTLAVGIMVLLCRDKDFGMPPRRDQAALEQPIYELPPQNWQPPQPPKEPWEQ